MQNLRIKVDSIELQVRDHEHSGEAIVFLHFGGGNLMMWQRAIPYFENDYRLILMDLRGHGKSDKPEMGYHIDVMAQDVAGVLEHLQVERAHVIGSSLGAEVGLSLAARYPEKVISLACDGALFSEYGPYGVWDGSKASFREHVTATLEKMRTDPEQVFPSIDALVDAKRQVYAEYGWWNEYVDAFIRYDACEIGPGKYASAWGRNAGLAYLQSYFDCRFETYYPWVKCPLLMLSDEEDQKNERAAKAMQGLCSLAPHAKIVVVPGWVHPYGWMLDPEAMCRMVLGFLAEVGRGQGRCWV